MLSEPGRHPMLDDTLIVQVLHRWTVARARHCHAWLVVDLCECKDTVRSPGWLSVPGRQLTLGANSLPSNLCCTWRLGLSCHVVALCVLCSQLLHTLHTCPVVPLFSAPAEHAPLHIAAALAQRQCLTWHQFLACRYFQPSGAWQPPAWQLVCALRGVSVHSSPPHGWRLSNTRVSCSIGRWTVMIIGFTLQPPGRVGGQAAICSCSSTPAAVRQDDESYHLSSSGSDLLPASQTWPRQSIRSHAATTSLSRQRAPAPVRRLSGLSGLRHMSDELRLSLVMASVGIAIM